MMVAEAFTSSCLGIPYRTQSLNIIIIVMFIIYYSFAEGVHHLGPSSSVAPPVPPYSATPAEGESIIIAALGAMSPPASTSSGPPPSSNNRVNASVSRGLDNPDSTSTLAATGLTPVEETRCTPV